MKLRSKVLVMSSVLAAALIAVVALGAVLASAAGDATSGKTVFTSSGCGGCHTLADAGATGKSGPNLDNTKPGFDATVNAVTNGKGTMSAFKGILSDQQIQDVAAYVVDAVNKPAPGGGGGTGGGGASNTVRVTLKGWKIKLSPNEVSAGLVIFEIKNADKRWHQFAIKRAPSTSKKSSAQSSTGGWAGTTAKSSGRRRAQVTRCRIGKSGLIENICKIVPRHTRHIYRSLQPGTYKLVNTASPCLWRCVRGRHKYGKGRSATLRVTEAQSTGAGAAAPGLPPLSPDAQAFVDAGCAGCHTLADARATGKIASNLDIGKPSLNTVADVVTNGIKHTMESTSVTPVEAMPAFNAKLTPEQIQGMASYVSRVTGGGDGSGQPAGRQNVLRLGCASCHTLADVGGTASDPGGEESYSDLDIAKASFATVKTVVEAGLRDMPKFKAPSKNGRVLNDQELAEAETYISNVTGGGDGSGQPYGRQTFLVKGCSSCHTLADAGGVGERASSFDIGTPTKETALRILDHNMGTSGTTVPKRWGLTPGMPSRKTYSAGDKDAIATYLSTITGGASEDPASGRQLSLVGGCGNCHVLADTNGMAKGGSPGPDLDERKPSFYLTQLVLDNGVGPQPPTDTAQGMPMYLSVPSDPWDEATWGPIDQTDVDEKFSEDEIDAVADYIDTVTG